MKKILRLALVLSLVAGGSIFGQPRAANTQLVIIVDGLRPDYVTPSLMPRLVRLGQRGVVVNAHHSVFPTVTRVNASSIATGTYPETHGLMGNTVYIPAVNAARGLDTRSRENLEAIARADGLLLTAPSLGEILQRAGKKLLAVGSSTSGATFLLNHTVANGAILHHEFTRRRSSPRTSPACSDRRPGTRCRTRRRTGARSTRTSHLAWTRSIRT